MSWIVFDGRVIQDHFPGIGRYAYNLAAHLPAHLDEADCLVVLHDPSALNTRYDVRALAGPRTRLVEYQAPIFGLANLARRPPAARDARVRLAHYPYYVRPIAGRCPSATTLYDAISFVYPDLVPSARARVVIRLATWLAVRASTAILTISEASARDIERYYPAVRGRVTVTPLAADPIFAPQSAARCEAARRKYGLPPRFALYLASNKPHKNLVRLVEAWRQVVGQEGVGVRLVVAGHQDPRFPQAPRRAQELGIGGQVQFIGEVGNDDMPALYAACDLFVFPSLYEGFGLTPLEAMACGAPVACSNASSLPEVAGDAAVLFDPQDAGAIAAACARVLADPALAAELRRRSLGQAARFTWDATARATAAVYRSLA